MLVTDVASIRITLTQVAVLIITKLGLSLNFKYLPIFNQKCYFNHTVLQHTCQAFVANFLF